MKAALILFFFLAFINFPSLLKFISNPSVFNTSARKEVQASNSSTENSFNGYSCPDDCSEHQAGYIWALENNISSKESCSNESQSLKEGCYSFVDERYPL